MQFTPKTQEQLDAERLIPGNVYDFEVVDAEDTMSKKRNDMVKITLKVFRADGGTTTLTDYLMEAMSHKLRHFAESTSCMADYNAGSINAAICRGRYGRVRVKKEPARDDFPARLAVDDYEKVDATAPKVQRVATGPAPKDDEPPF